MVRDIDEQIYDEGSQQGDGGGGGGSGLCLFTIVLVCVFLFGVLGLRISPRTIKVSWYNPALLGTNCATVRWSVEQTVSGPRSVGRCVSTTASGMPWQSGIDWSAACAPKYPFGTVFFAGSLRPWVCKDRGGAIRELPSGAVWVDMLVRKPVYPFGTEVPGVFLSWRPLWAGR